MRFPATFTHNTDDDTVTVRFPDLPEAFTVVAVGDDAMAQAADCLEEALASRIADREDIPAPASCGAGQTDVPVSGMTAIQVQAWRDRLTPGRR